MTPSPLEPIPPLHVQGALAGALNRALAITMQRDGSDMCFMYARAGAKMLDVLIGPGHVPIVGSIEIQANEHESVRYGYGTDANDYHTWITRKLDNGRTLLIDFWAQFAVLEAYLKGCEWHAGYMPPIIWCDTSDIPTCLTYTPLPQHQYAVPVPDIVTAADIIAHFAMQWLVHALIECGDIVLAAHVAGLVQLLPLPNGHLK